MADGTSPGAGFEFLTTIAAITFSETQPVFMAIRSSEVREKLDGWVLTILTMRSSPMPALTNFRTESFVRVCCANVRLAKNTAKRAIRVLFIWASFEKVLPMMVAQNQVVELTDSRTSSPLKYREIAHRLVRPNAIKS